MNIELCYLLDYYLRRQSDLQQHYSLITSLISIFLKVLGWIGCKRNNAGVMYATTANFENTL